jgi:hypothetical protein
VVEICSTHGEEKESIYSFSRRIFKESYHSEDLGLHVKITRK